MGEKEKKKVAKAEGFVIQPTSTAPPIDTSKWPLLLKVRLTSYAVCFLLRIFSTQFARTNV